MKTLGLADDNREADGHVVLAYFQAANLARLRAREAAITDRPIALRGGHTVKEAAEEYLEALKAAGEKLIRNDSRAGAGHPA